MSKTSRYHLLSEGEMLDEEAAMIWGSKDNRPKEISGIALSGGGVRAATVALGVLQCLAEQGLLAKFSYISTVSGGGYIGSALTWFWSKCRLREERLQPGLCQFGCQKSDFPFQDSDLGTTASGGGKYTELSVREKAIRNLAFLKHHGSYLTSGDGVGSTALVIAVVRTVLVSLLVWVPLLVGIFLLTEAANESFGVKLVRNYDRTETGFWCGHMDFVAQYPIYLTLLGLGFSLILLFCLGVITLCFYKPAVKEETPAKMPRRVKQSLPYLISGGCLVSLIVWYFVGHFTQPESGAFALLGLLAASGLLTTGIAKLSAANTSYLLRRGFDKCSYAFLPTTIVFLFLGAMPFILPRFNELTNSLGGTITLISGIGTALYGYYTKAKSIIPGFAAQILAVVSSILFLLGLLWFSFGLSHEIYDTGNDFIALITLSFFLLALVLGTFSSVNTTGLHRFYRDRLMETFMPMADAIGAGLAKQSEVADTFSIADMWDADGEEPSRPFHLINAHAILIGDKDAKIALRGGENYAMSAATVGSTATGWLRTSDYIKVNGPFTLASAMAASGAAANANAGYIGTGVTRDRFVSAVMSTLNIRLGLWVCNPRAIAERNRTKPFGMVATYFGTALSAGIFRWGNDRNSKFIELSDGGHFENLGLYELVRRKAALILAVDAEQDEGINLSSLVSSTNRIKEDFGATIRFLEHRGPEQLIGQVSQQYPGGVKIAKSPYIVGDIQYNDEHKTRGVLIYLKATMIGGLDFATDGYRASHPDFPHQTTADQFFDPEQFDAYRDLGRKSCSLAIKQLGLCGDAKPERILREYGFER